MTLEQTHLDHAVRVLRLLTIIIAARVGLVETSSTFLSLLLLKNPVIANESNLCDPLGCKNLKEKSFLDISKTVTGVAAPVVSGLKPNIYSGRE